MRVTKRTKLNYRRYRVRYVTKLLKYLQQADAQLAVNPLNSSARALYKTLEWTLDHYFYITKKT